MTDNSPFLRSLISGTNFVKGRVATLDPQAGQIPMPAKITWQDSQKPATLKGTIDIILHPLFLVTIPALAFPPVDSTLAVLLHPLPTPGTFSFVSDCPFELVFTVMPGDVIV
jgi:hypothetical protein